MPVKATNRTTDLACIAALVIWLASSVVGFSMLVAYSQSPGTLETPPLDALDVDWHPRTPFRLFVAIHPQCTCSRATANELARILHDHSDVLACKVLMYQPESAPREFGETWLMSHLATLPNTTIVRDVEGRTARTLGMRTSGSVVLYGPTGSALFYGGITVARGHEGDSVGSQCILSLLENQPPATTSTDVYGCPLERPATSP
ncbi:hypothetical protein NG895_11495 [Aeoliella sp. ICT_H6.2]|uniref:RedB protein n=1 Tax=Aeoliella straminimaris TaxID=2954799 RepID=A0A9X2JFY5_9BACT|nr:hypothetical protein [Aeoliella straminimaris]MCO6044530.1 hypothetical protein [Aeoliella straminimaris]